MNNFLYILFPDATVHAILEFFTCYIPNVILNSDINNIMITLYILDLKLFLRSVW